MKVSLEHRALALADQPVADRLDQFGGDRVIAGPQMVSQRLLGLVVDPVIIGYPAADLDFLLTLVNLAEQELPEQVVITIAGFGNGKKEQVAPGQAG